MAATFLLLGLPLTGIALLAFLVAGIRTYQEGGEEVIKNVYIYLVLFATLMMVIGGSVAAFMSIADIVAPEPYYQTFDDYKRYSKEIPNPVDGGETKVTLTDEELRNNYNDQVNSYRETQIGRAKNTLIKSTGWIFIPLPVFLFYQRLIPKRATN